MSRAFERHAASLRTPVRMQADGPGRMMAWAMPTARPNTRMQPHRPDRVKQERQQGKEKMHAAGAALDYRARGLTGESIHELLGTTYCSFPRSHWPRLQLKQWMALWGEQALPFGKNYRATD